jgi:alkaline phosphatase D
LLAAGAAGYAALAGFGAVPGWARKRPAPLARDGLFSQGVASGAPGRNGVTLWTRLAESEGVSRIELEVARDPGFDRVVHRSRVSAGPGADFCVHPRLVGGQTPDEQAPLAAADLQPGETYWYRFATANEDSPVGRFRTLPPAGSDQPVRIGFWTCQRYIWGRYPAHLGLAAEPDLDLVVCLGDYIYEVGGQSRLEGRDDFTGAEGDGTAASLADYREKYLLYRSDPALRDLHARHAMHFIFDDHEVINNWWREGHEGRVDADFATRKRDALRAWFEHIPTTRIPLDSRSTRIYRRLRIGELAELFFLDERQYRDPQPPGDPLFTLRQPREATMLGTQQKRWLKRAMQSSRAPWKVLANGVQMSGLDLLAPGVGYVDIWDAYPSEREELVAFWREHGIDDVIVMTGDDHNNYAGVVTSTGREDGDPGAVEFVVPSVSSENFAEILNDPTALVGLGLGITPDQVEEALATVFPIVSETDVRLINPHLELVDHRRHGYCVLELRRDEARVSFRHVASIKDPASPTSTTYEFRVPRGRVALERV